MTFRFLLLFFLLCGGILYASEVYKHPATEIEFPPKIEDLVLVGTKTYKTTDLGESIVFQSDDATATVYIYDQGRDDIVDDESHTEMARELAKAVKELKEVEKKGIYKNLEVPEKAMAAGSNTPFPLLYLPLSYDVVKNALTEEPLHEAIPSKSLIGVGIFRGYFVKLRYSFREGVENEEILKKRNDFIQAIGQLVSETAIRPKILNHIETYLEAPLSDEARNALPLIKHYGDESHRVLIKVNAADFPWLLIDDYPYGLELTGAQIVGQIRAQLQNGTFGGEKIAGKAQAFTVYNLLKAKDPEAIVAAMETWETE